MVFIWKLSYSKIYHMKLCWTTMVAFITRHQPWMFTHIHYLYWHGRVRWQSRNSFPGQKRAWKSALASEKGWLLNNHRGRRHSATINHRVTAQQPLLSYEWGNGTASTATDPGRYADDGFLMVCWAFCTKRVQSFSFTHRNIRVTFLSLMVYPESWLFRAILNDRKNRARKKFSKI